MTLLSPLPARETAAQACARSLKEAIVQGRLKPGERLPPERDLAATFGVNRLTLRSALGQLQSARLLSVRHGSGYQVRDFRREAGPELLPTLALSATRGAERLRTIADLLFVRRLLARAVVERLVEEVGRDRRLLARLDAAVDRFAEGLAAATTPARRMELDLTLVGELAEATGSTVLRLMANPIAQVLEVMPDLAAAGYQHDLSANVDAARALVAGLRARTPGLVELTGAALEALDRQTLARLRRPRRKS